MKPNTPDFEDTMNAIGNLKDREIVHEMQESFLDYAMSVIVDRALPDVRDGLKPVHRRILYSMSEQGLTHNAKFRKSASVVGDVLAKYHPHGDVAVYDSMVHMAQDFSMRYPLIDGQGNFGSLDGDPPAAYRYTEARMTLLAEAMLEDIEKDTVAFRDNFDATSQEPSVLPTRIPTLLLNGTLGIAVGMATDIPPHNLSEVSDAIIELIDNPKATTEDILKHIKGPDFPTGGIIYDVNAIRSAYSTGKGSVAIRARTEIAETKSGMFQIIVTEIPYRVNKATLLQKFADLVRDKKVDGIKDIRDESDKNVRIVIDLKKEALPNKVLNQLFNYSQLQETFHLNMLALVDGIEPMMLDITTILENYVKHRQIVVRRRTEFELKKAKDRAHILEGLKIALDHIDEVIAVIKKSPTKEDAFYNLIKKFGLSELQTRAILDMRLQTLAGLERKKIEEELEEKRKLIAELESILASAKKILGIVKAETLEIKEKFGDERRTQVIPNAIGEFKAEDLIPEEKVIITITKTGYVKRLTPDTYRLQNRGGKGVIGMSTKEEDEVDQVISADSHDDILFFTNKGRVFQTKVYELPESSRTTKGQALVNFLELKDGEYSTTVFTQQKDNPSKFLVMATKKGLIKKVSNEEFSKVRRSGMIALNLKDDDELKWVKPTSGKDQIILSTELGQSIRFQEDDVRPMGRLAAGVRGIKLKGKDLLMSMDMINKEKNAKELQVLIITEHGLGKKTNLEEYKVQGRGGSGIKTLKVTEKTGKIVSMHIINKEEEADLVMISREGQTIRTKISAISTLGRDTQGVRIMKLTDNDKVASSTVLNPEVIK